MESKKSVKTILVDDDLNQRKIIKEYISKIDELDLSETFDSTQEALNFMIKNEVELIVFNSDMKEQNSADFLKQIDEGIAVIFLHTNWRIDEETPDSSSINYVFKTTLNLPKFRKAIERASSYIKETNISALMPVTYGFDKNYFLIKDTLITYKLKYNEVSHISALENYVKIHAEQKTFMVLTTLLKFEKSIQNHPFLRVHRSFIVNLDFIYSISKDIITLSDGSQIPIGEQYKKNLEALFVKGKMIKR
jgi:two-component system, LytTR family, response regulator